MQSHHISRIAREFLGIAIKNDSLLKRVNNTGIFFMPEIAFAYECGIFIAMNKSGMIESNEHHWLREKNLGLGPIDCLFLSEDKKGQSLVIEFKMDDTIQAYAKDIEKLHKLNSADHSFIKLFCSLKHLFKGQEEKYIEQMKTTFPEPIKLIKSEVFRTNNGVPEKDICLYTLWAVDPPEELAFFLEPNLD